MNYKGKTKSQMTRRGKFMGKTSHFKKAIVTLKEGDKINLFENV
jgi:large subunit ribosomal protein L23